MIEVLKRIEEISAGWSPLIWRATWQGGLYILATWLFCRIAKDRLTAALRHSLWWLASAQLFVRLFVVNSIPLPILPPEPVAAPPAVEYVSVGEPVYYVISESSPEQVAISEPPYWPSVTSIAFSLWLLGVGLGVGLSARRMMATRRLLRAAKPVLSPSTHELLAGLCERMEVRRSLL